MSDRKIIDGIMFFNELSTLDMRLHELDDVVDYFIIVESMSTHSGKPKPLHYEVNKSLFTKFHSKIIHHVVDGKPRPKGLWDRMFPHRNAIEFQQRSAILDGVKKVPGLKPDDIVFYSDADEVPNPASLDKDMFTGDNIVVLNQRYFFYDFGCENLRGWPGPTGMTYRQFAKANLNKLRKRKNRAKLSGVINFPEQVSKDNHGGWHCSNFGGVDRIVTKLESFTHRKYDQDKYKDKKLLEQSIKERKDWIHRTDPDHQLHENDEESDNFLPKHRKLIYRDIGIDASKT